MNWFRALKTAAPLEQAKGVYMDVGHCGYDGTNCPAELEHEEFWWIDPTYKFASSPVVGFASHNNTFGYDRKEVCHGRYTKDERYPNGATTLVWDWETTQSPLKLRAAQRKVRSILEKQYGRAVQILEYLP